MVFTTLYFSFIIVKKYYLIDITLHMKNAKKTQETTSSIILDIYLTYRLNNPHTNSNNFSI